MIREDALHEVLEEDATSVAELRIALAKANGRDRSNGSTVTPLRPADEVASTPVAVGTSIVIPACNEAETIADVVERCFAVLDENDEVIVIDDGSTDGTAELAELAGARVISRPYRMGNGAAIKTGIRAAKGSRLVMLDADGQHDPALIPQFLSDLDRGYDMVVGARSMSSHASLGRKIANAVFNGIASKLSQRDIKDLTSGFRAVRKPILDEFLPLLPNQFSYPTTITLASLKAGYSLKYLPFEAATRTGDEPSKIRPARDGIHFLQIILKIVTFYAPMRVFAPISLIPAGLGLLSFVMRMFTGRGASVTGALLASMGLFLFCIGLISEQIAALRFERTSSLGRYEPTT